MRAYILRGMYWRVAEAAAEQPVPSVQRAEMAMKTKTPVIGTFIDGMVRHLGGELQENRARVREEREAAGT